MDAMCLEYYNAVQKNLPWTQAYLKCIAFKATVG